MQVKLRAPDREGWSTLTSDRENGECYERTISCSELVMDDDEKEDVDDDNVFSGTAPTAMELTTVKAISQTTKK